MNWEVQPRHFLIELFRQEVQISLAGFGFLPTPEQNMLASTWFEKNTSIRRKDASGAPQFSSRPEAGTNTRCRSGMTKLSTRGLMLSTFMPSKRRVELVVKERNVLLATAGQSPTQVADKNCQHADREHKEKMATTTYTVLLNRGTC